MRRFQGDSCLGHDLDTLDPLSMWSAFSCCCIFRRKSEFICLTMAASTGIADQASAEWNEQDYAFALRQLQILQDQVSTRLPRHSRDYSSHRPDRQSTQHYPIPRRTFHTSSRLNNHAGTALQRLRPSSQTSVQ